MTRKFKKNIKKMQEEKRVLKEKKNKLPYYAPTHKDLDLKIDIDDIIYKSEDEEIKESWISHLASRYKRFKYKIIKKYGIQEIYVDIMFFLFEIFIAISLIYIIMIIVLYFKGRIR